MKTQLNHSELKLEMVMQHAPVGFAEIDHKGSVIYLNAKGKTLLKPVMSAHNLSTNNLFPLLELIAPSIVDRIQTGIPETGNLSENEISHFSFSFGGENIERHFNFTMTWLSAECITIIFEDITEKYQKEQAILQFTLEKAIAQGKFEIASNILHDIGNAIVGFSTYISRIARSAEQDQTVNLQNLSVFFETEQKKLATIISEAKAEAVVKLLKSMTEAQKNGRDEIQKSIKEQRHIITHIQDILTIQRQYLAGHELDEKSALHLRSIINDCMSMLLASIEKRGIRIALNVPEGLPVIHGNRTKLMQVILNILKNSMEAIDFNAAEKQISLNTDVYADTLILEIKDNGQGFDEATAKQAFRRGFTTKASGTGLGLSNCRAIIENHGGMIDITSEGYGKGALTTIKFKI
jgi:signal transduction histidine kinase